MRISILQPGYLPWLGYFEQLLRSDVFVHYDDVQYTACDWRNRNRIGAKAGTQWLTVPVSYRRGQRINEVLINNSTAWARKHIGALRTNYAKSPFFDAYFHGLADVLSTPWQYLVDLDLAVAEWVKAKLGIHAKTIRSSQIASEDRCGQGKLIRICEMLGCDHFYEGHSGRAFVDTGLFESHGITVEFQDYKHPYYRQRWVRERGFISHLSVVDLLFNQGPDSLAILTGAKIINRPEGIECRHANDV